MIINHNMGALNANRQMSINQSNANKSMQKLSSGLRINNAGDDAAGLAISEKMRGQIRGLDQASSNAQDGISLIQTAEGALSETHSILQRMRELSVQASNDTLNTNDRGQIQKEIDQLTSEIDRISSDTEFNTKKLLNGGAGLDIDFTEEKVNNNNTNWIEVVGGTASTGTGTISITSATAAKGATVDITVGTANAATTQTITINGTEIKFEGDNADAGTNIANLKKALDDVADKLGIEVSVSGTTLSITSKAVGKSASLDIAISDNAVGSTNGKTEIFNGSNAQITATGIDSSEMSISGNTIKVTSGDYKGLEIKLNGSVMSATANTNVSTFNIKSNGVLNMHIGANEGQTMNLSISDMSAEALGVNAIDVSNSSTAGFAITTIQDAIDRVSDERSKLGSYQNRLEHTINNLGTSSENLTSAESRIRDVNMAKEMSTFSKNNILSQAAQAMLAQANNQPQQVLQLLR